MSDNSLDVQVRMTPASDSGGSDDDSDSFQKGTISFTISDKSTDQSLGGVTVRVTSNDAPYDEEKSSSSFGMVTFNSVPMTACTLTLEKTGYETETIEISESDWGNSVTRGYN